jgi:hypothetical protein
MVVVVVVVVVRGKSVIAAAVVAAAWLEAPSAGAVAMVSILSNDAGERSVAIVVIGSSHDDSCVSSL